MFRHRLIPTDPEARTTYSQDAMLAALSLLGVSKKT